MVPFDKSRYKPGNPRHTNREWRQLNKYSFLEQFPHYTFTHPRPPYHTALTGTSLEDKVSDIALYKGIKYVAIGAAVLATVVFAASKLTGK